MENQSARIDWRDGAIPVSQQFDDPYFSLSGGLAETAHVFLAGNDLPARFRDGFAIAEIGFGTGLNLLATLQAWEGSGQTGGLKFTSFEAFPMTRPDMARALSAFPGLAAHAGPVLAALEHGPGPHMLPNRVTLQLVLGDARQTLPRWAGRADAWFLDGFSPAKNPELWGADLLAEVARHTAPGGTAATYTAAGHVRRSLADAGFEVTRVPGFGTKRHMTRAHLADQGRATGRRLVAGA